MPTKFTDEQRVRAALGPSVRIITGRHPYVGVNYYNGQTMFWLGKDYSEAVQHPLVQAHEREHGSDSALTREELESKLAKLEVEHRLVIRALWIAAEDPRIEGTSGYEVEEWLAEAHKQEAAHG